MSVVSSTRGGPGMDFHNLEIWVFNTPGRDRKRRERKGIRERVREKEEECKRKVMRANTGHVAVNNWCMIGYKSVLFRLIRASCVHITAGL